MISGGFHSIAFLKNFVIAPRKPVWGETFLLHQVHKNQDLFLRFTFTKKINNRNESIFCDFTLSFSG